MLNLIKKALLKNHYKTQIEADLRLNDLCQTAGEQVDGYYGQRGTGYDVLAEVDALCRRKDRLDEED